MNSTMILVPADQLSELIEAAVAKAIRAKTEEDLMDKYLSAEETRGMFTPRVSRGTINTWANAGILIRHTIGGSLFFKYSEIMEAATKVKKYDRQAKAPSE